MVEQGPRKPRVAGSNPAPSSGPGCFERRGLLFWGATGGGILSRRRPDTGTSLCRRTASMGASCRQAIALGWTRCISRNVFCRWCRNLRCTVPLRCLQPWVDHTGFWQLDSVMRRGLLLPSTDPFALSVGVDRGGLVYVAGAFAGWAGTDVATAFAPVTGFALVLLRAVAHVAKLFASIAVRSRAFFLRHSMSLQDSGSLNRRLSQFVSQSF